MGYNQIIKECQDLFNKKTKDYGTAWRILRLPSLTDQIFIKAKRIRSIQETGEQKVSDSINSEFKGIINYCIMSLIQIKLIDEKRLELPLNELMSLYGKETKKTLDLFNQKNHDYGEAWRSMRVSSITDIILMKLLRVKQIEDNKGKTIASEGVDANYRDILNYAVFALILSGDSVDKYLLTPLDEKNNFDGWSLLENKSISTQEQEWLLANKI